MKSRADRTYSISDLTLGLFKGVPNWANTGGSLSFSRTCYHCSHAKETPLICTACFLTTTKEKIWNENFGLIHPGSENLCLFNEDTRSERTSCTFILWPRDKADPNGLLLRKCHSGRSQNSACPWMSSKETGKQGQPPPEPKFCVFSPFLYWISEPLCGKLVPTRTQGQKVQFPDGTFLFISFYISCFKGGFFFFNGPAPLISFLG